MCAFEVMIRAIDVKICANELKTSVYEVKIRAYEVKSWTNNLNTDLYFDF